MNSTINFESILAKVESYTKTPKMQKRMQDVTDKIMLGKIGFSLGSISGKPPKTPEDAAAKFCEVLAHTVSDHIGSDYGAGQMSQSAAAVARSMGYNAPYKVGNRYYIDLYFADRNLHRESLAPDHYSGIDNIIALLNSGYSAGHVVYGVWEGHTDDKIASLTNRGGAHFIEQAVDDFMGNYGVDYGVLDIEVSEEYK